MDMLCRPVTGRDRSPPQVKAAERSVAPSTLWVWAPDAVVQSTAPVTSPNDRSINGRKGKHGQVGKGKGKAH
jgi:hypothetical protein